MKGTLHDTLKINTLIFPQTCFIFLVTQLPLALTSKGNAEATCERKNRYEGKLLLRNLPLYL